MPTKIKPIALKDFTGKQAWELIHPLIMTKTEKSFNLNVTNGRSGRKVIHAARGNVYVEHDGAIKFEKKQPVSDVNCVYVNTDQLFTEVTGLGDFLFEERNGGVLCHIYIKYEKVWKDRYAKRAQSHLIWLIMLSLPEANKRIAYACGAFFSNLNVCVKRLNLIAQHIELLQKVILDDRRLLCAVLEMLNQGYSFVRPDTAIKETKDLLLARGLSECGWRKFVSLNAVEKQGWIFNLIGGQYENSDEAWNPKAVHLLNLISLNKINIRIYNPEIFSHVFHNYDYVDHWTDHDGNNSKKHHESRRFVLEVALREAARVQKENKGRLSNRLLLKTMGTMQPIFDYVNGTEPFDIPRGAGLTWLKRQSDIWHEEIAIRKIEAITDKADWSEYVPKDLVEIKMQDDFVAIMLTSTEAFYKESNQMHHCVSSRWEDAYEKNCYIYHLHHVSTDKHATLDIRKNQFNKFEVYECRSFCNANITTKLKKFSEFVANHFNQQH